jgi:aryl-alcohol dehydrogenase-like predicted oxidoreductase
MTFSTDGKGGWGLPAANESESIAMLDRFVELGGNFIDTADVYGTSEDLIGKWLAKRSETNPKFRDSLVLATKGRNPMGLGPNDLGLSRKHILKAVESSLKRLQTSYIDLYQVHRWDADTPLEETMSTLNDLVRCGKIRYIGCSNFTARQIQKSLDLCKAKHWEPFVCLQPQYSLMCRATEWDLMDTCTEEGLGCIPWSPLAGGWLSGAFKRGMKEPPKESRVQWAEAIGWKATDWTTQAEERTWKIIDELFKISEEIKASVAQVALRWLMQQPGVTCPIVGAKSLKHLEDNLGAYKIQLTDDHMKRLKDISEMPRPYPYGIGR